MHFKVYLSPVSQGKTPAADLTTKRKGKKRNTTTPTPSRILKLEGKINYIFSNGESALLFSYTIQIQYIFLLLIATGVYKNFDCIYFNH